MLKCRRLLHDYSFKFLRPRDWCRHSGLTLVLATVSMTLIVSTPLVAKENRDKASAKKSPLRSPASNAVTLPDTLSRSAQAGRPEHPPIEKTAEVDTIHLLGNWGGRRGKLSNEGIDLSFVYKFEINRPIAGKNVSRQDGDFHTDGLANFDARAAFNLDKLGIWQGASAFVYLLANHGDKPSKQIGDIQYSSSIETPYDTVRLYEAWIQKFFFENRASILIGLHDLNSEFYLAESAALFFHSSFGIGTELGQTGTNGPSIFPVTAPSVRLRVDPSKSMFAQAAIFNGESGQKSLPYGTHMRISPDDGVLAIGEFGLQKGRDAEAISLPGKYVIGSWGYSKPAGRLDGLGAEINRGIYIVIDQSVSPFTALFLTAGAATAEVNPVQYGFQIGAVTKAPLSQRPNDRAGVGVAQAYFSDVFRRTSQGANSGISSRETALELNYRSELAPGLAIQPIFQLIIQPSGKLNTPPVSVLATRIELNF